MHKSQVFGPNWTIFDNAELSAHQEKSGRLGGSSLNSTWQNFLHRQGLWCLWQIWGMCIEHTVKHTLHWAQCTLYNILTLYTYSCASLHVHYTVYIVHPLSCSSFHSLQMLNCQRCLFPPLQPFVMHNWQSEIEKTQIFKACLKMSNHLWVPFKADFPGHSLIIIGILQERKRLILCEPEWDWDSTLTCFCRLGRPCQGAISVSYTHLTRPTNREV